MSRKPSVALFLAWAACVGGALLVARMPGDPGSVPTQWLVLLTLLGILAARGGRLAWAALVGLHLLLVASFLLVVRPVSAQLVTFYLLATLALLPLLAAPLADVRAAHDPHSSSAREWRVITSVISVRNRRTTVSSSSE